MHYIKLIKLLYLVDREALRVLGRHVSGDRHVSMDNGPVLSGTYQLISEQPRSPDSSFWHQHISAPHGDYEISNRADPGDGDLSEAEVEIIESVFKQYGRLNRWKLVDLTHELPEWRDPSGSALPIRITDILHALGVNQDAAQAISGELEGMKTYSALFK